MNKPENKMPPGGNTPPTPPPGGNTPPTPGVEGIKSNNIKNTGTLEMNSGENVKKQIA